MDGVSVKDIQQKNDHADSCGLGAVILSKVFMIRFRRRQLAPFGL
jgi:hypothetical protein